MRSGQVCDAIVFTYLYYIDKRKYKESSSLGNWKLSRFNHIESNK